MLRTLINCSRLMRESPWLMFLGAVVVVVPGGLLLTPWLASRVRRSQAVMSASESALAVPIAANESHRPQHNHAKSDFISFVPSVGKLL